MTRSTGGRDSDDRWVLRRQPRDPRGVWPPSRTELVVYAVVAALLAFVGVVALVLVVW